jgi:hypothetical protein
MVESASQVIVQVEDQDRALKFWTATIFPARTLNCAREDSSSYSIPSGRVGAGGRCSKTTTRPVRARSARVVVIGT